MSNSNNKTKVIKKIIDNMEILFFYPYIYKICTLKPEDIYDLFYGNNFLTYKDDFFTGLTTSNINKKKDYLFNVIMNFIYIDVYYFDIIINPEKYYTNKDIIIQEKNIYTGSYTEILKIIQNEINKDSNKYLELYKIVEEKNNLNLIEYEKNTKRLFIKNFIKLMRELIYKYEDSNAIQDEFMLKVIYNILSNIKLDKILYIYENEFINSSLIDEKILKYSKDNILTYLKVRNTNIPIDNYNRSRFDVIGYGDSNKNYADTLFLKYNNDDKEYNNDEVFIQPSSGYTNEYFFGPFNRIFFYNETNKDVANNITDVKDSLINGKNIFIVGYGASGSGKTSTLVYLKTPDNKISEDGIIVHICKNMKGTYDTFKVKCIELSSPTEEMNNSDERIIPSSDIEHLVFKNKNDELILENDYIHKPIWIDKGKEKKFNSGTTKMGDVILYMIDEDRYIRPTLNNPKSSRSHYIIFIQMLNSNDKNKNATLIVGDFAGVENQFNCNEDDIVQKYFNLGNQDNKQNFENYYTQNFIKYNLENLNEDFFNENDEKYTLINIDEVHDKNINDNFIDELFKKFQDKSNIGSNVKIRTDCKINIKTDNIKCEKQKDINSIINKVKKNISQYKQSVEDIFSKLYNSTLYKKNKDIMDDVKKIINNFNQKLKTEVKKKDGKINISAESFLYSYYKNPSIFINNSSKINDINILNLINFSNIHNIIDYLSISKGVDTYEINSFIYYLTNFIDFYKEKLYNYWAKIFNDIIKKKKEDDKIHFYKKKEEKIKQRTYENKQNYIQNECNKRVKEGFFINETLTGLRELITIILEEKNKDKITISPQFLNNCFDFYCTKNNCFEITKVYKNVNSKILKILTENNININELIMCVFCVLNISPNANNPPPVKYVDINTIKKEFFNNMNNYNETNFKMFFQTMLKHFKINTKNVSNFNTYILEKLKDNKITYSLPSYHNYKNYTQEYIEHIDKYNAITPIGTLDFVDKIAKFNLTNITCNKEITQINDKHLIQQLGDIY